MSTQQRPDFGRARRRRQRLGMVVGAFVVVALLVAGAGLLLMPSGHKPQSSPAVPVTPPASVIPTPSPTPEPSLGAVPVGMTLATLSCSSGKEKTYLIIGRVATESFVPGASADVTDLPEDASYELSDPAGTGIVKIDLVQRQLAFVGGPLDGQTTTFRGGNGRLNFMLEAIAGSAATKPYACAPAF